MEFLMILPILGAVLVVVLLLGSIPLYLSLKIVDVHEGFFKALIVNLVAGALSLVGGLVFNFIGIFLAGITNILSIFLPFVVLIVVLQQAYGISTGKAVVVSLIQYVVSVILVIGMAFAVLIPLGIGGAALLEASGGF